MDNIEKYIQSHRAEFDDVEEVRIDQIWKKIEKDRPHSSNTHSLRIWIALIFGAAVLIGAYFLFFQQEPKSESNPSNLLMAKINEETNPYQVLVDQKTTELNLEELDQAEYAELFLELQSLEDRYTELIGRIQRDGNMEEVIQDLISYHERKLRILDLISKEINIKKLEKLKAYEFAM